MRTGTQGEATTDLRMAFFQPQWTLQVTEPVEKGVLLHHEINFRFTRVRVSPAFPLMSLVPGSSPGYHTVAGHPGFNG